MSEALNTMNNMCPLCSGIDIFKVSYLNSPYRLGTCIKCGLGYVLPRPTEAELSVAYSNFDNNMAQRRFSDSETKKMARPLVTQIKAHAPMAKNIIEIGTSTGYLLHGLQQYGYEVAGSDLSAASVLLAKNQYGLSVFNSAWPEAELKGSADVLLLSHIIEHVIEPRVFLAMAGKFLKPGGIIIIATPNFNSLGFKIFGWLYPVVNPPIHISFFNHDTLDKLVAQQYEVCANFSTSYDSMGRNSMLYSFLVSFKRLVVAEKKSFSPASRMPVISSPSSLRSALLLVRRFTRLYLQYILSPLFFLIDKVGAGDNCLLVAKKKLL